MLSSLTQQQEYTQQQIRSASHILWAYVTNTPALTHGITGTPMEMIKCPNSQPAQEIKPGMTSSLRPLEDKNLFIHTEEMLEIHLFAFLSRFSPLLFMMRLQQAAG